MLVPFYINYVPNVKCIEFVIFLLPTVVAWSSGL